MTTRVFISYRTSDGADKATALARDLDALFGGDQIFLDKEDLSAGCRWRDEIGKALGARPIVLVLVTPDYFGARESDGTRRIDRVDDPARDELEAAIAVDAQIIPLLCDGVAQISVADSLAPPFHQLSELTWRRLRAYDWRADVARLVDDLKALGVEAIAPAASSPAMLSSDVVPTPARGRRRLVAAAASVLLVGGGFAGWRWWQQHRADLSGAWITSIGARGAPSARAGEVTIVNIRQVGDSLELVSNAVDVTHDRDWQNYGDFWKQRTGTELKSIVYRGEGKVTGNDGEPPRPGELRRVLVPVRIELVGSGAGPIDTGTLRGTVDPGDQHIRARLWIDSERGERVVDLRRQE
ncbi:MAG: toll/interleukin-1 receptor domain-containing protein [Caldimonas sp.]